MRPVQVRMSADGVSAWVPFNRYSTIIAAQVALVFSSNANLHATGQYTNDPLVSQPASATRSTTTVTLTLPNHGLNTNDSVIVTGGGVPFDGQQTVASVADQNTVTYTVTDTGPTSAQSLQAIPLRVHDLTALSDKTAYAEGSFTTPPTAVRLKVASYSAGYVDLNVVSGGK